MNIKSILTVILAVAVLSCEAENDTITSTLFDQSVETSSVASGPVNMRNGSVRINGSVSFYDSGGPAGNYSNNENLTLTVYPATTGYRVRLILEVFNIEFGTDCPYDIFEIFDGTTVNSTRIDIWCGSGDSFWVPHHFVASNSSGALTIRFRSDSSTMEPGWVALLSQVAPTTNYSVILPRAVGLPGNSSMINYTVTGPTQLPTDQGFCISTSSTSPSRTNGADCYTASVNRYGTRVFTLDGIAVNTTHYMRAFYTPPGSASIYSSMVTYSPMSKDIPHLQVRHSDFNSFIPLGLLN